MSLFYGSIKKPISNISDTQEYVCENGTEVLVFSNGECDFRMEKNIVLEGGGWLKADAVITGNGIMFLLNGEKEILDLCEVLQKIKLEICKKKHD